MSTGTNRTFSQKIKSGCKNLLRNPVKEIRWQAQKLLKKQLDVEKTVNKICDNYLRVASGKDTTARKTKIEEAQVLEEKLGAFFEGFGPDLNETIIRRTGALMTDLYADGFIASMDHLGTLADFLYRIEFLPDTGENRAEAVEVLQDFVTAKGEKRDVTMAICLKYLYPAIYDINKWKPLTPALYFMQPRSGLNQTFRYLNKRLKKSFPWPLKLYEMRRGKVPMIEYYTSAAWFMRDMATASVVFVHESNNLMGHLDIRPETRIIQLWHGCGVLKKIGLSTAGMDGFKSAHTYQEYPEYNKYSLVTIASPELSWVFEEFMGIPKESGIIQPLGVARTDEFYDKGYKESCYEKLYQAIPAARDKKVILYAPTYRGVDPHREAPNALDFAYLSDRLSEDYILIVKHHQTVKELPEIPEPYRDTFAYDMTHGRGMNINDLMTVADVCITDYSSVAFEFSLFERPLLFFVYDMDEYIDNRGLYYDFDELSPGPLCRTNEELADELLKLKDGFDNTEIKAFRARFMCRCDGHACERVIRYLVENLLPVPEDFREMINERKAGDTFLGWNVYKYEGDSRTWLCGEDKTRLLVDTKDAVKEALSWDPEAYFKPVWQKKGENS